MHTELKEITDIHQSDLSRFVEKIGKDIAINKIVCFGIRAHDNYNWSAMPLEEARARRSRIDVDLLVVPDEQEKRSLTEIAQMIENITSARVVCNCIVHNMQTINKGVENNNLFFTRLYKEGILLLGNDYDWYFPKQGQPTTQQFLEQATPIWHKIIRKANRFYENASLCLSNLMPEQCVFSLHQAIEQTAIALLRSLTGYKPNSHNIEHLLSLLHHVSFFSHSCFPRHTHQENLLFSILKNSYIDARYKDDYSVSMAAADLLHKKTGLWMQLATEAYQQQINAWQEDIDLRMAS